MTAGKVAFDAESEPRQFFINFMRVRANRYLSVLVRGLDDKKIIQIACGQQHSVALDSEG